MSDVGTVETPADRRLAGYLDAHSWIPTAPQAELDDIVDALDAARVYYIRVTSSLGQFLNRRRLTGSPHEVVDFIDARIPGWAQGFITGLAEIVNTPDTEGD